jgi:hypothetical protein
MDGNVLTILGPLRRGVLANVRSGRMSCRNYLAARRKGLCPKKTTGLLDLVLKPVSYHEFKSPVLFLG